MNISHKVKFNKGADANQMLVKKLVYNFLNNGKMVTSLKKAKTVKAEVDSLVCKIKKDKANAMHGLIPLHKNVHDLLMSNIKGLEERHGGYIRLTRVADRLGDASKMARVEWVTPFTTKEIKKIEEPAEPKIEDAVMVKETTKTAKPKKVTAKTK